MTTNSPVGTTTQRPRWRSRWRLGLAMLLAATAAAIGLATVPALGASASPVAAKPAAVAAQSSISSGTYTLYYSWGCTGAYASVQQTFNSNGTISAPGSSGYWVQQNGTLMWNYTAGPAIYAGNVDGPTSVGMMTVFNGSGSGNGCWYMLGPSTSTTTGPPPDSPSPSPSPSTSTSTSDTPNHQQRLDEAGNTR
jgi:hypothetical protein